MNCVPVLVGCGEYYSDYECATCGARYTTDLEDTFHQEEIKRAKVCKAPHKEERTVPVGKYLIYIDMDGVLVDLESTLCRLEGITPEELLQLKLKYNKPGYDHTIHLIHKNVKAGLFERARTTLEFYDIMRWAKAWERDGHIVEILSSVTSSFPNPEIIERQKRRWLRDHNVGYKANFAKGGLDKKRYATPHAILIDDTHANVEAFALSGGRSIFHFSGKAFSKTKDRLNAIGLPTPEYGE